jgi:hypothetical protein
VDVDQLFHKVEATSRQIHRDRRIDGVVLLQHPERDADIHPYGLCVARSSMRTIMDVRTGFGSQLGQQLLELGCIVRVVPPVPI